MKQPVFTQQCLEPSRVGFRNSNDEGWIWYAVPKGGQSVINFSADRKGYSPYDGLTLMEKPVFDEVQ